MDLDRRAVLRGLGFALPLPVLPSLVGPAFAADPVFIRRPRFFAVTSNHGAVFQSNMYPATSTLTERTTIYPGHEVARGRLVRQVEGATASISPALTSPATLLTDRLASRMNVVCGFDLPFYIGHHTGAHLGCNAGKDGMADAEGIPLAWKPTIDQVMAWSRSFYPTSPRERSLYVGNKRNVVWGWSNPIDQKGTIDAARIDWNPQQFFDRILGGQTLPKPTEAPRKPIVDRILESYKRLREGNRRLSAEDRRRLDDHMARLALLDERLRQAAPVCTDVKKPPDVPDQHRGDYLGTRTNFELNVDVLAAAVLCGITRIAVLGVDDPLVEIQGSWHQDVAHQFGGARPQMLLVQNAREIFTRIFLNLAAKLDVDEGDGSTFLDNSFMTWTHESGFSTHNTASIPIVTIGSGAGFFSTGNFLDYRNHTKPIAFSSSDIDKGFTGLTYDRWLATVMQGMGLARAEFERDGRQGYGDPGLGASYKRAYVPGVIERASEIPPFLRAKPA